MYTSVQTNGRIRGTRGNEGGSYYEATGKMGYCGIAFERDLREFLPSSPLPLARFSSWLFPRIIVRSIRQSSRSQRFMRCFVEKKVVIGLLIQSENPIEIYLPSKLRSLEKFRCFAGLRYRRDTQVFPNDTLGPFLVNATLTRNSRS